MQLIKEKADLKNVNLAYELEDGQKIYIPNKEDNLIDDFEVVDDGTEGIVNDNEKNNVININKASEVDLQTLPGIGEGLATAIVKYRNENGNFKNIEDLKQVVKYRNENGNFKNIEDLKQVPRNWG